MTQAQVNCTKLIQYIPALRPCWLGLSNPPAHPPNPPNPPVPDRRSPDPTAPRVGHGSRFPKPDAGGSVSSSHVENPWNPTRPKTSIPANFHWFRRVFSLIWQISATKIIRSGIDTPDPEILDTIWRKNNRIWRNPHRILAGSGEISPILAIFLCFPSGFGLTRNRWHPPENRPAKPDPLTGRLRVENMLPDLLRVGLRVGHKPDPPHLWTPLATRIDYWMVDS